MRTLSPRRRGRCSASATIVAPAAALEPEKVVDLMAALEASVTAAKSARQRHPTAHDGADEAVEAEPQSAAG